jgi:acyl-CoA synthetase (AMP-forming)/AMP-acid ligase II
MVVRERITIISGPPTLFATLMELPDFASADVSSLRLAFIGAAAVPTEIILRMEERMGIERVCNAYGLIEGCVVSMTRAEDTHEVISTTAGSLVPGVEVRIVDAAGRDVPTGERGEIWIRSQGVMSGYWRDPEQTAASVTPEGWLRSGDVGVFDAGGNLRIVDRLKDSYNCGGFSAYPAEIESQLLSRPELAQAAVVGVPHERLGEVGHAFVVAATGRSVDVDSLSAWSRENMAGYKVPRSFRVVKTLPLNANGKVAKDVLRARIVQGLEESS